MSKMRLPVACCALLFAGAASANSLDGEWVTDCLPTGKDGRHGQIMRVIIKGDRIQASKQMYAGDSCDMPTVQTNFTGSLAARSEQGDHQDLDIVVGGMTMTPNDQGVVELFNKWMADNPKCGAITWKQNEPVAVAGKSCGPLSFAEIGTRLFDKAWIAGDQLRFGAFPASWRNITLDKRPTAPLDVIYRRVGG